MFLLVNNTKRTIHSIILLVHIKKPVHTVCLDKTQETISKIPIPNS